MAEKRKFAALAALHHQQAEIEAPEAATESATMPPEITAEPGRGGGGDARPPASAAIPTGSSIPTSSSVRRSARLSRAFRPRTTGATCPTYCRNSWKTG